MEIIAGGIDNDALADRAVKAFIAWENRAKTWLTGPDYIYSSHRQAAPPGA